MKDKITISARTLGELALPNFCARCFWIKSRADKLPFQIPMPGVFSSIDSYSKNLINKWFDRHRKLPCWLSKYGEVVGYQKPPHYSKFFMTDEKSGITLRGSPDAIFVHKDGSYMIADYKTAKYTERQDELLPLYEVQLNAYALIAQYCGMPRISDLALIYFEPMTDDSCTDCDNHHDDGFTLKFSPNIHRVEMNLDGLRPLLMKAKEIYESKNMPPCKEVCENCEHLQELIGLIKIK